MVNDFAGRILLIDDSDTVHKIFGSALTSLGHEMHHAYTGEEGLEKAGEVLPECILLDYNLPGLNGYEVCKRLKEDPGLMNIPLLILTDFDTKENLIKLIGAGADGFIGKGEDIEVIVTHIKAHLRIRFMSKELLKKEVALRESEEIRIAYEKLKEAEAKREYADRASAAKSDFLANMSHDIRTPLSVIVGAAELLGERELEDGAAEELRLIRSNSELLLTLLSDVLDMSKIENGKIDLSERPFELKNILEMVMDVFSMQSSEKGITLTSGIDPALPDTLIGDPVRLEQVIMNIVGNAVKFTDDGGVRISIQSYPELDSDGSAGIYFTVSDTGPGIAEEERERIFEKFTQAAGTQSARPRGVGTGLGLTISKALVELMGGSIWVESEVGRGSAFHFTVSLGECRTAEVSEEAVKEEKPKEAKKRGDTDILLVEDNIDSRNLIRRILEKAGYRLDMAADGEEAVKAAGDKDYDLILMDVRMPVMDGYEATRRIREAEKSGGKIRRSMIVALTAHAFGEARKKCEACGMDGFLTKPVRKKDLLEAVEKQMKDKG